MSKKNIPVTQDPTEARKMRYHYHITERSYDGKVGIHGADREKNSCIVTMPFFTSAVIVTLLTLYLNFRQVPLEDFRNAFMEIALKR